MTRALLVLLVLVGVGTSAAAQTPSDAPVVPRAVKALHWTHFMLQAADTAQTEYLMGLELQRRQSGLPVTFREANPVVQWCRDEPVAMTGAKVGYAIGLEWLLDRVDRNRHDQKYTATVVGHVVAIAAQMVIVVNNQKNVRQAHALGR